MRKFEKTITRDEFGRDITILVETIFCDRCEAEIHNDNLFTAVLGECRKGQMMKIEHTDDGRAQMKFVPVKPHREVRVFDICKDCYGSMLLEMKNNGRDEE